MPTDIAILVGELDAISDADVQDVKRLDQFVSRFFAHPRAALHVDAWFRLFERFPEHDNYGFWSILHALEKQPNCDVGVLRSVQRKPSRFPVLMVNRMLNAGIYRVDGVELLDLLRGVVENAAVIPSVSADAQTFLHRARA
jgi:hypothetical protein